MQHFSIPRARRVLVCALVVGFSWPGTAVLASPSAAHERGKIQFISWNTAKHTAKISLTAGLTSTNHTLNFNGYTYGSMVLSVPKGYRVTVSFTNKSTFNHSAVFTQFADKSSEGSHPVVFAGASSPDPIAGTPPDETDTFSFTASKVGTYAIICEVSHHADAGMWDVFKVTHAKQPSEKFTAVASPTPTP